MAQFQDLTGMKFGELTVLYRGNDYILPCGKHQTMWVCKCSCGKIITTRALQLKNGDSISCGHKQKEIVSSIAKNKKKTNKYDLESKDYGIGFLRDGKEFWFDKEDYELIKDLYWQLDVHGYIYDKTNNKYTWLAHLITHTSPSECIIDHIHGSETITDNRKSNLRIVTKSQNQMNRKIAINNTSGVVGVNKDGKSNKWRARIMINQKEIYLGSYNNFEDAVVARKEAEEKYFGEYSYDNSQKIRRYK